MADWGQEQLQLGTDETETSRAHERQERADMQTSA